MASLITIRNREELFSCPSLEDICIQFCVAYAKPLLLAPPKSTLTEDKKQKLQKSAVNLPNHLWEKLIKNLDSISSQDYAYIVYAVHHKIPTLRTIHLRNCVNLKDEQLRLILANYPVSLDIHNCPCLTKKSFDTINKFGKNLECLIIGNSTQILPTNIDNWMLYLKETEEEGIRKFAKSIGRFFAGKFGGNSKSDSEIISKSNKPPGLLLTRKLKKLVIWGHHVTHSQSVRHRLLPASTVSDVATAIGSPLNGGGEGGGDVGGGGAADSPNILGRVYVDYWEYLTREFILNLKYLDLSSCQEVLNLDFLLPAKDSLVSLHLYDVLVDYNERVWNILSEFKKLRYLDISQYNELASIFADPGGILKKLTTSLPDLQGLDISGTNLAGFEPPRPSTSKASYCCINGLSSRLHRPFQFLGLLGSHYDASNRINIPAKQVAGGDTMDQLLCAMNVYMHRDSILRKAIRILHEKIQMNNFTDFVPCYTLLDLLLQAIAYHMEDKHTVIVSLAAMFHVLKRIVSGAAGMPKYVCEIRMNRVFLCVVRGMEVHGQDLSLLRNGVLILLLQLSHLNMNAYFAERVVPVLLKSGIVASSPNNGNNTSDVFLIKSITHLLYAISNFSKNLEVVESLRNTENIEQMCSLMEQLLNAHKLDHMPTLWLILLNWTCSLSKDNLYSQFEKTRIIDLCFKLIQIISGGDEEYNEDDNVRLLQHLQKPILAFLTNLVHNVKAGSVIETQLIKSDKLQLLLGILERNGNRDQNFSHVCCGFLANLISKQMSHELLGEAPSRDEILSRIFEVMSTLSRDRIYYFTFRNLGQLYSLVASHNAPEVRYWALWTLLKLAEDGNFVKMMIRDGKLKSLDDLSASSEENCSKCSLELEGLWDLLSKKINGHLESC